MGQLEGLGFFGQKMTLVPYADDFSGQVLDLQPWEPVSFEPLVDRGIVTACLRQDEGLHLMLSRGTGNIGGYRPPGGYYDGNQVDYPSQTPSATDYAGRGRNTLLVRQRVALVGAFRLEVSVSDLRQDQGCYAGLGLTVLRGDVNVGSEKYPYRGGTQRCYYLYRRIVSKSQLIKKKIDDLKKGGLDYDHCNNRDSGRWHELRIEKEIMELTAYSIEYWLKCNNRNTPPPFPNPVPIPQPNFEPKPLPPPGWRPVFQPQILPILIDLKSPLPYPISEVPRIDMTGRDAAPLTAAAMLLLLSQALRVIPARNLAP
ncbi:MAG: hypothetical protein KF760_30270 [Candidatus Eremiobacteraeota bacterium]|nr:hypothetical protein [Candidatus Eremiobacteraeota bacterium]